MAKFTLHNQYGDFMHDTARTLKSAKDKCLKVTYKCKVMETYIAPSPWNGKPSKHGREVFRNY